MDVYSLPKSLDIKNLRYCLDNYVADSLLIRRKGSEGGQMLISEYLEGKRLDFQEKNLEMDLTIDGQAVFHFPLNRYTHGFSMGYERPPIPGHPADAEHSLPLMGGKDPDDPSLISPTRSVLRHILDGCLLEIYFTGKVPLQFHSWKDKARQEKYWTVTK